MTIMSMPTKQELVDEIRDLLNIAELFEVSNGSSVPRTFFAAVALNLELEDDELDMKVKQELAQYITEQLGQAWDSTCFSSGRSGGGTVTAESLVRIRNGILSQINEAVPDPNFVEETVSDESASDSSVGNKRDKPWGFEETLLALDFYLKYEPSFPGKGSDEIRKLSDTLQKLPIIPSKMRSSKFRNANGVYMKLMNLRAEDPRKKVKSGLGDTSAMDKKIWESYEEHLNQVHIDAQELLQNLNMFQASPTEFDETSESESVSAQEGGWKDKLHRVKERRSLREPRLSKMLETHGKYFCECCSIQSPDAKDPTSILEVHHIVPLAEIDFIQQTTLEDLAVLCANCHRLIHARIRRHNQHVSPEDLQLIYYPDLT
jgi:5-methylcytosine-specific restriction enzyme A